MCERSIGVFSLLSGWPVASAEENSPASLYFSLASIFLTHFVWNVQMFPFGNGRLALLSLSLSSFSHT